MKLIVHTTHGKTFRRCGIEFGPDDLEVTVGDRGDPAKLIVATGDVKWLRKAAGPSGSGAVLAIREGAKSEAKTEAPKDPPKSEPPKGAAK